MRPQARLIKGNWPDSYSELMTVQHAPFVYIQSNGSHFAGTPPDDIDELLAVLAKEPLDPCFEHYGNFWTVDPCEGVRNPNWNYQHENEPQWIDGPRIFAADGVVSFFGNFLNLSHVFGIYTNDPDTIRGLMGAIRANQQRPDYQHAAVTLGSVGSRLVASVTP